MMMQTAWQLQQERMDFFNNNHDEVSSGMPHHCKEIQKEAVSLID